MNLTQLHEAILDEIASRRATTAFDILGEMKRRQLVDANGWEQGRKIDRALQALRRAGRIEFRAAEWHIVDGGPCPHCGGTGRVKDTPAEQLEIGGAK